MISFIEENDKIDQTQCEESIEKQRVEIEQRYREEMKQQRREKFERENPKRVVIDHNSFEFKERLRKEEERQQRERQEFWEEHRKHMKHVEEEEKMIKAFIDAGWTVGRLGGRDRGLER